MVVYSHLFCWSTFILSGVSCDDVEIEIYQFLLKSASNFSTNVSISKNVKRHNAIWELLEPRNYLTFAENSRLTISSPPSTCVISARNHPIFIINYLSSSQSSKLFFFIKKIDYTTHTSEKKSRYRSFILCGQLHLTVLQINFRLDPENYSDNNGINYDNFLYMHILFSTARLRSRESR